MRLVLGRNSYLFEPCGVATPRSMVKSAVMSHDVRFEFARLALRLRAHLSRQRQRGRTPDAEPIPGFAIDDGEAEGLIHELVQHFGRTAGETAPSPSDITASGQTLTVVVCDAESCALCRSVRAFELTAAEYDAVLLALAVELDARFARLVAYLNDHVHHTRPTLGLATAIAEPESSPTPVGWLDRPLIRDGLLELEGDGPISGLAIRIAPPLVQCLLRPADERETTCRGPALEELCLPASLRAHVGRWVEHPRASRLLLSGPDGSGRATLARALLEHRGHRVLERRLPATATLGDPFRDVRRDARWHGSAVLLHVPSGWDPQVVVRGLDGVALPVAYIASPEVAPTIAEAAPDIAAYELGVPEIRQRVDLWTALLPELHDEPAVAEEVAAGFRYGPGKIAQAVARVRLGERLGGTSSALDRTTLIEACRHVGAAAMPTTAQRLPVPFLREDLVLPANLFEELDLAVGWIRNSHTVFDRWGFGRRIPLGRGLTALFSGDPGTGKTMAAQVLARQLGLDIYRVDLSAVTSKYIGETEKNIAHLFDAAHECGGILFFDEADALFGRRSEVRDAHDRYANLETGFLLQRMEEHEGVTVLATNRAGDLDDAFIRRFHVILRFPMPDAEHRLRLWRSLLLPDVPGAAAVRESPELARLARMFAISGGEIRNAVLAAAFIAASASRELTVTDLRRALGREFTKRGRILDQRQRRELEVA